MVRVVWLDEIDLKLGSSTSVQRNTALTPIFQKKLLLFENLDLF